jgi:translation initiation factor 3 subunit M
MSIERPKLLFVDGTFAELAQAMADIVQVGEQVKPLLEKEQNEEALQTIVKASSHLNTVPEKDFNPAYNLLIHLVLESKDPKKYLPIMCGNLLKPITSSPVNHMNLASNALTTIFNNLEPTNPLRYNVFMQICRFLKQNNHYEGLRPMLKNLPQWLKDWDTDEEDARKLYVEVAEIASEGGDGE